jgi:hypothetical protein
MLVTPVNVEMESDRPSFSKLPVPISGPQSNQQKAAGKNSSGHGGFKSNLHGGSRTLDLTS